MTKPIPDETLEKINHRLCEELKALLKAEHRGDLKYSVHPKTAMTGARFDPPNQVSNKILMSFGFVVILEGADDPKKDFDATTAIKNTAGRKLKKDKD